MEKKWTIYVVRRYSSVGWDFDTFAQALRYARNQRASEVNMHGTDKDFWVPYINGPGGRMSWPVIQSLFT